jgi:hypothetical protein
MVVKPLPVIPVTAFDLAVMSRCSRTLMLVSDVEPADRTRRMDENSHRFAYVSEFRTVVSSVTPFDFSVVMRSGGADQFMRDLTKPMRHIAHLFFASLFTKSIGILHSVTL